MYDLIRDAPFGQLVRYFSKNRLLQYPEERADFQVPESYTHPHLAKKSTRSSRRSSTPRVVHPTVPTNDEKIEENEEPREAVEPIVETDKDVEKADDDSISTDDETEADMVRIKTNASSIHRVETLPYTNERLALDQEMAIERTKSSPIAPTTTADGLILADWYTTDDQDNPQNWSQKKKFWTAFLIDLYTFVVYASSSIYISSELLIMERFGVADFKASLGLALYVLGLSAPP